LYELEIITIIIMGILIAVIYYRYAALRGNMQNEARKTFETWRESDLLALKSQYAAQQEETKKQTEMALEEKYKGLFTQWCQEKETGIREDAIARSQSTVLGRVTEHLAPYLPQFDLNPRDARFVGSPIDLIVFNGLTEGDLKNIVFVEIKSGQSQITPRERSIRDIVSRRLVEWRELRIETTQNPKHQ
jgi:predicted Holliday junction resolvase-like endonuclease